MKGFGMEISAAINKYLKHKSTEIKEKSVVTYGIFLQKFNCHFNKPFEELTEDDIDDFKVAVKQKYAPSHYAQITIVLKDFVKFCRLRKMWDLNEYFIKVPRYKTRPHNAITFEEFTKLCDTLSENNFTDLTKLLVIKMLWWTGVRVTELCNLDLGQIDTQKREILIEPQKSGQTNRLRMISWSPDTHVLLCKYLGVRLSMNQSPALFISPTGQGRDRITARTVQRWIKECCQRAGVTRKISPHSFRHGIQHFLKSLGISAEDIQGYIGHTNVVSTIQNYMVWDHKELSIFRTKIEDLIQQRIATGTK